MLRNNLSVLLAERQLRISEVAKNTGISRTTLTALSANSSKMIQFETINEICQYLKVSPSDLFEYVPFDFKYSFEMNDYVTPKHPEKETPKRKVTFFIEIFESGKQIRSILFDGFLEMTYSSDSLLETSVVICPQDIKNKKILKAYTDELSTAFLTDIKSSISKKINDQVFDWYLDFDQIEDKRFSNSTDVYFDKTIHSYIDQVKERRETMTQSIYHPNHSANDSDK